MSLLAIELEAGRLTATVLERDQGAVAAGASASVEGGLEALPGLLDALGPHPRAAILLSDQVTAACVDAPPTAGLPPARIEGLIRWELESYLPDAHGALVCGWSAPRDSAGPLLGAALPQAVRDDHVGALTAAGLRPAAIYPALGAAAALLPEAGEPCTLVELSPQRIGCARVEAGRVVRFRSQALSGDPVDAVLELEAADAPLTLAGPLPAALERAPEVAGLPRLAAGDLSASVLGAACRHWGLPGGERVPALPACAAAPPVLARGSTRAALALALLALLIGGLEFGLGAHRYALQADVEILQAHVDALEGQVRAHDALSEQLAALDAEAEAVAEREGVYDRCAKRRAFLPALLAAVAEATPESVVVEALAEEGGRRLRLSGFAVDELSVRALQRDLATRLSALGLAPLVSRVRRSEDARGAAGYAFDLSFAPVGDAG